MDKLRINIIEKISSKIIMLTACLLLLTSLTGCFSNYGRVKRNTEITQAFATNQVPPNYKYFYWGRTNMPYVVMGLDPDYNLQSKLWREVDADTEQFKEMVKWVWGETWHYPEYPRGADIVDPTGKKIGIWYSIATWAAVKMLDDQGNIMIAPDTPWNRGNI